jgi:Domain of unknown function (DUF4082)/Bacterial Ig-like domain/Bacterial Ig domain
MCLGARGAKSRYLGGIAAIRPTVRAAMHSRLRVAIALCVIATALFALHAGPARADACGPGGNPISCENSLPGTSRSQWDISSGDGATIAGFADPFSVDLGGTINFKIESPASSYNIDIYRMGYYGGDGARLITSLTPNISVSQNQPACNTNTATGLVDCSNWGISASWTVPTTLVSGVYFAHIYRTDASSDANQIPFVVRDDSSHSDILFKTDDETWEAYNAWGGYSLYAGNATDTLKRPTSLDAGRAEQVSYDRPFSTRFGTPYGQDFFFYAEFPMIEFLEENGYDVSYIDQGTLASPQGASLIEQHKVLVAAGHDEYWSAQEVANVTAARNAGVNLAFFTGNEVYWTTRWGSDAAGESGRTLITYKESLDSAQTDPDDPPTWTGAWDDPRFSPPGDGGQPQNALTGQLWTVNAGTGTLTVPYQYAALRFWRNTPVASLQPGQAATLTPETVGYEWDQDIDNGFRPPGDFDLSSTTMTAPQVLQSYQEGLAQETVTHNLTMYRASSGALVFEAGTVQWAWGLNSNHDGDDQPPPSQAMQQATVNLLADMGNVQPATLMPGLTPATESTDTTPPASAITSPAPGATIANGSTVTVTGTATDSGGGVVAGAEISTDGGSTWHPVTTMSPAATTVNWSYTWAATGAGQVTMETRATDDSGNIETPTDGVNVTVNCPCSLYSQTYVPSVPAENDRTPIEAGVRFQSTVNGWVAGVRFYKGSGNNGTHTGSLWSASGTLLATGTFTNETASGWQTLLFANSVQISANTTYVAGYYDPDGHYAADAQQFYPAVTGSIDTSPLYSPPLVAVRANYNTGNDVFNAGGPGFPTTTYQGSGYGVDVIFDTTQPSGTPPAIVAQTPYPGSSSNPASVDPTVTFSKAVVPSTLSFTLADSAGNVPGSVSFNQTNTTATFTPTTALPAASTVTVTISGAQDQFGQTMTPVTNTFITALATLPAGTCPCSLWPDTTVPATTDSGDVTPVELGVKFRSGINGHISGIRFYKSAANTGTHTGTLWSATGTELATGTFTGESTQGWQQLNFTTPVAITAGTTYVASYYDPSGHYSVTPTGFKSAVTNGPLTALASGTSANGVYLYGQDAFPTASYNSTNYWVDVVFSPTPAVTSAYPLNGQTSVPTTSAESFTFDEPVQQNSISFSLTDSSGNSVPGSLSYSVPTNTATFTPSSALSNAMTYTATVSSATDTSGDQMAAPFSWSFVTAQATAPPGQCPCSIWPDSTLPAIPDANDTNAVNLGVKFTPSSNGYITGVRFYKGPTNTGTHVGSLWTSTGTLLAQVTFSNESVAGWQQANFSTPIPVTAGTTYVASYFAPIGEYATLAKGLSNAVTYGPLTALASGGVYTYATSSTMPKSSYNAGDYFVDVVFNTSP